MNNRQIEAFRAIAHTGTVTAAADALHITQPAVSRLLADLQRKLQIQLFDRVQGRLKLTPEGGAFLQEVERHYMGFEQLQLAAQRIAQHGVGNLRILAIPSVASGSLPGLIHQLLTLHPDTAITLDTDTTDRIAPRIASGEYDVGFAMDTVANHAAVQSELIATRPWHCVLPPGHELSQQPQLSLAQLQAENLIGFSAGMSLRARVDDAFYRRGLTPNYKVCAQTIESICALVKQGIGAAIIHPYTFEVVDKQGLLARPLAEAISVDLFALTPAGKKASMLTSEIIAAVKLAYQL